MIHDMRASKSLTVAEMAQEAECSELTQWPGCTNDPQQDFFGFSDIFMISVYASFNLGGRLLSLSRISSGDSLSSMKRSCKLARRNLVHG